MSSSLRPFVIGIAGPTASGKTTMARKIIEALGAERASYIPYDHYYKDLRDVPMVPMENVRSALAGLPVSMLEGLLQDGPLLDSLRRNFDHPDSLDTPLLVHHLSELRSGHPVDIPVYDLKLSARTPVTEHVEPREAIIVDGILALADETLRDQFDMKIYTNLDLDLCHIRRQDRDVRERGRSIESVNYQYLITVRPMHRQFVEPTRDYADIIVPTENLETPKIGLVTGVVRARMLAAQLDILQGRFEEAAARMRTISRLSGVLLTSDVKAIKKEVVAGAAEALGADNVTLHQYDSDTGQFLDPEQFSATWPVGGHLDKPRSAGLSALVVREGTLVVQDIDDRRWRNLVQTIHLRATETKAFLGIRLASGVSETQIQGVVFLNFRKPREFSADDLEFAGVLAAIAATAIQRAQLSTAVNHRADQSRALSVLISELLSAPYEKIKNKAVEFAAMQMPPASITLHQYDAGAREFLDPEQFSATWPPGGRLDPPRPEGISAYVVHHGALVVPDINDVRWQDLASTTHMLETNTKAFLGFRLEAAGEVLGVLFFNYDSSRRQFTPEDTDFAKLLAFSFATAIQIARLQEQTAIQQRAKKQAEDSLAVLQSAIIHHAKNEIGLVRVYGLKLQKDTGLVLSAKQREWVDGIVTQAQEAIAKLRDSASIRRPPFLRLALVDDLISEGIDEAQAPGLPGIEVRVIRSTDLAELPRVWVDQVRTALVFAELIFNAEKAITDSGRTGGKVEVNARLSDDRRFVEVLFTNDGPPIPKSMWEAVFEGKRVGAVRIQDRGAGIGLFNARQLLAAQGSSIRIVESNENQTVFAVLLPTTRRETE